MDSTGKEKRQKSSEPNKAGENEENVRQQERDTEMHSAAILIYVHL